MDLELSRGDTVLIDYNREGLPPKLATFYEKSETGYLFKDSSGFFTLTDAGIRRIGIQISKVEE